MSVGGVFLFNFIFLFENAYSWFTVQVPAAELGQAKDRSLKVHLGLSPVCASRRAQQVETTPGSGARPKTPALGNGVQTFQTSQLQHQTPFSVSVSR